MNAQTIPEPQETGNVNDTPKQTHQEEQIWHLVSPTKCHPVQRGVGGGDYDCV